MKRGLPSAPLSGPSEISAPPGKDLTVTGNKGPPMSPGRLLRFVLTGVLLHLFAITPLDTAAASPSGEVLRGIEESIRKDSGLRVYDWVTFSVRGSEVTLSGFVASPLLKRLLERRILALDEVSSVDNQLEVIPSSGDDIGMQINAYWRIYGHPELRRLGLLGDGFHSRLIRAEEDSQRVLVQPIHILVRDGHITLEGEVESERYRNLAEEQTTQVMGVRSVTNHIIVTGAGTEEHEVVAADPSPWQFNENALRYPLLSVENPSGKVTVKVTATDRLRIRKSSPDRETRKDDTRMTRLRRRIQLVSRPSDGALIDLDIDLPYGYRLEVTTVDGPIAVTGLLRYAELNTGSGSIELTAPWRVTRLGIVSRYEPEQIEIPDSLLFADEPFAEKSSDGTWSFSDSYDPDKPLYGEIQVKSNWPRRLVLNDMEIPPDSPVRMHWEAPRVLARLFRSRVGGKLKSRANLEGPDWEAVSAAGDDGAARFSSDVRLVDLTVAVLDDEGRPLTDLRPGDFEVLEDGEPQEVKVLGSTEAPFNLALLLDCSTSTLTKRKAIVRAAKQFVSIARPQDRVAVYAVSDTYFQMLSPLTNDREELLRRIDSVPPLSGGTPLYDAIVISYAQELARRRFERNALMVISDGVDNQILPPSHGLVPSKVPFADLKRAAAEMNSMIYAIHLRSRETPISRRGPTNGWDLRAQQQLEELVEVSGGRLFPARSIRALDPVYERVAAELRSVYTIGYYPKNQDFEGSWRNVEVRVSRANARVRTRPGYYAW